MVLEGRNVSLRGRCKESDTLWKSWQAQYFVDVAKTLAGVCHSKDCVLRDRRRESAPWMLCFEVEGLDSWEGLHFRNLNLRVSLRGQCSISYDLGSWFRGRRSTSETCFHFRGSLAQNARFGSPELQFSRKSRTKRSFWMSGALVFEEVSHKTLVLELRIFSFRGSLSQNARFGSPELQFSRKSLTKRSFWKSGALVFEEVSHKTLVSELRIFSFRGSLSQNARFGSPELQFSRKSRTKRSFWMSGALVFEEVSHKIQKASSYRDPKTDLTQVVEKDPDTSRLKVSSYRDLAKVVPQDPDTSGPKGLIQRSCTSVLITGILYKCSCRILIQWPKGSSYRDPERDLALVLLHTEILHKWCYRIPTQAVQRILIQRSCTSGPTRSWYKWSKMILIQRSWDRDLALVLLQDPDTSGPKG